jgi:hypothetical protein
LAGGDDNGGSPCSRASPEIPSRRSFDAARLLDQSQVDMQDDRQSGALAGEHRLNPEVLADRSQHELTAEVPQH